MNRTEVEFESGGATCRAWLYRPEDPSPGNEAARPCVVMAHGFGATRDASLEPYALPFVATGVFPPSHSAFDPALTGYAYDPQRAKALLAQAIDWLELEDREVRFGAAGVVVEVFAGRTTRSEASR